MNQMELELISVEYVYFNEPLQAKVAGTSTYYYHNGYLDIL